MLRTLVFSLVILFSQVGLAQSFGGASVGSFRGFSGWIGFGVSEFTVLAPAANFKMNQGINVSLGGERELGQTGFFITLSINYMTTDGESFYNYTDLAGQTYSNTPGTDVDFNSQNYQLGLGLKAKLFPTTWFRPYGEAGGLFGYHAITYGGTNITPTTGYKDSDGLVGFGYYFEGGVEIDFSDEYGIKASAKYEITETRPFDTLSKEEVKYEARIFQFALLRKF